MFQSLTEQNSIVEWNLVRRALLSDFLTFTRFFYKEVNRREFTIPKPVENQSHIIIIANALTDVFQGKVKRLLIECPPGFHKSEMVKNFIAYTMAWYSDCMWLYISYAHELAADHTSDIKKIMTNPMYKKLFGVEIGRDSSAKAHFKTLEGGTVAAFGSKGAVTGNDAGLPTLGRFTGGIIIDDIYKPDEVFSDNYRTKIKSNFYATLNTRLRSAEVPIIMIGHRLHEDDLFTYLKSDKDGDDWKVVTIQAEDEKGNPRYPEAFPKHRLESLKYQQYEWFSQYMQDPINAGNTLFDRKDFPLLDKMPNFIGTFITVDSGEEVEEYNDPTVFNFMGIYQVKSNDVLIPDLYALHCIDCWEERYEAADLEDAFKDFWVSCMRFHVPPTIAMIEKKSTGVTLCSVVKRWQGLKVIEVERAGIRNNKSVRFVSMQQYIRRKLITFSKGASHAEKCITHMSKITANQSHKHDDIADTFYDGVKNALMDKTILNMIGINTSNKAASVLKSSFSQLDQLRKKAYK